MPPLWPEMWFKITSTMCGGTSMSAMPVATERLMSRSCQGLRLIFALSASRPADHLLKPTPRSPNRQSIPNRLGTEAMISAINGVIGSVRALWFFALSVGNVHVALSRSNSDHRIPPLSSRLHPVRINSLTILPKLSSPKAFQIAASHQPERTRSRDGWRSIFNDPTTGFSWTRPISIPQEKRADRAPRRPAALVGPLDLFTRGRARRLHHLEKCPPPSSHCRAEAR